MGIIKIVKDTKDRISTIEFFIKIADSAYKSYLEKGDAATYEDYQMVVRAVNQFYKDGYETVQIGRLMFDELPISMYETMKNHRYRYARSSIAKMDKRLLKTGIDVEALISFEEREKARFVKQKDTPDDVMGTE